MSNLKNKFEEVIHLTWSEFTEIENSENSTVEEELICSLVRSCADSSSTNAIKIAFDRVDGLLEIPLEIKVPKFYIRYVNAKEIEGDTSAIEAVESSKDEKTSNYDPATAKLRETLQEMRKMPKQVIALVLGNKQLIDEHKNAPNDPMVKSVIVANLIYQASKGKINAVDLIFDQIDGKLARTINLLGGQDVYIDDYAADTAPAGAIKDENGYYIAESSTMTAAWIRGFANSQKGLESILEEVERD